MPISATTIDDLLIKHHDFLNYLWDWFQSLRTVSLLELTDGGRQPRKLGILSEDLIKGFTSVGRLSSPRVAGVLPAVVELFTAAHEMGVHDFVFPYDSHPPDSPEFDAYGPHCVTGTVETETVDELTSLPFADEFIMMPKQSLNPAIGTDLEGWLDDRPEIESIIVVGDCTDLCVYQAAMHLKVRSNAMHRLLQVIVPEDCVQTYDIGVEDAKQIGATPHDGDLMHLIFLYHMMLNDIKIVSHVVQQ